MEKLLIIEDDNDINNLIAEAFEKAGYECVQAFSGTEGLLCASNGNFSLVIMDLMLPGMTGEELLPKLKQKCGIPVIVLSAKDTLDSKISLLNMGAEDYMTKPFAIDELIARAGVQIRRFSGMEDTSPTVITRKGLTLCKDTFSAEINGNRISLTKQEFKIMELLISHPNKVFSKQDIYNYAWEDYYIGEDKTINMHISNIRKKLKAFSDDDFIETVWGIGFKFCCD